MTELVIDLPPLPRALNPNSRSRSHWPKTAATKAARTWAYLSAMSALQRRTPPKWEHAMEQTTFYWKDKRSLLDPDNIAAMLKPVWDGFQDAGIIKNDRGLMHLPVRQAIVGSARKPGLETRIVMAVALPPPPEGGNH